MSASGEFWAYDNWHRDRARVHQAGCPFCNHGRGVQGGASGDNGQWLGPFSSAEDALARVSNRADARYCGTCARCSRADAGGRRCNRPSRWATLEASVHALLRPG